MWRDILVSLVFGFPAGLLSLVLSAIGIAKMWVPALVFAGVWCIPATIYLSAASGFPLYLLCLLQFGGAYAVYKKRPQIAWYLLIPLLFLTLYMMYLTAYAVMTSPR